MNTFTVAVPGVDAAATTQFIENSANIALARVQTQNYWQSLYGVGFRQSYLIEATNKSARAEIVTINDCETTVGEAQIILMMLFIAVQAAEVARFAADGRTHRLEKHLAELDPDKWLAGWNAGRGQRSAEWTECNKALRAGDTMSTWIRALNKDGLRHKPKAKAKGADKGADTPSTTITLMCGKGVTPEAKIKFLAEALRETIGELESPTSDQLDVSSAIDEIYPQ